MLELFSCVMCDVEVVPTKTLDEEAADMQTGGKALLIIKGTMEDVGARRVKKISGKQPWEKEPTKGAVCDLVVGNRKLVEITGATYEGKEIINDCDFYRFTKNVTFWVYGDAGYWLFHVNRK